MSTTLPKHLQAFCILDNMPNSEAHYLHVALRNNCDYGNAGCATGIDARCTVHNMLLDPNTLKHLLFVYRNARHYVAAEGTR